MTSNANGLSSKSAQSHSSKKDYLRVKPLHKQASINDYKLLKTIGKGFHSKVKLAKSLENQRFYAIKIIKRHQVEQINLSAFKKIMMNEVDLIQSMNHPNIIKLVEYNIDGEVIIKPSGKAIQVFFIVLELVEQGDLFSFIKVKYKQGGFNERFARYYFQQLLSAMEYIHDCAGIVHRDLKPENLLLNQKYDLKIADFGLSSKKEGNYGLGIHYSQVGTRQYQAPEVLERRSYRGEYVDIFSIGVILFLMVTGTLPYLTEAHIKDPMYKFLYNKKRESFWRAWRQNNNREDMDDSKELEVKTLLQKSIQGFKDGISSLYKKMTSCRKRKDFTPEKRSDSAKRQYELAPKEDEEEVVVDLKSDYSQEFKDLVVSMMSYHFYDRPSIKDIKSHPWFQGEIPSQDEIIREMSKLKKEFIIKEIQHQSSYFLDKERKPEMNLPKSFREYAVYCYKTNNTNALFKGVMKMTSHVCYEFGKNLVKCNCFRKLRRERSNSKLLLNESRRPIWMHSGLAFKVSNNNANTSYTNQTLEKEKHSGFKERKNSRFKFRPNQLALQNTLANRLGAKNDFALHLTNQNNQNNFLQVPQFDNSPDVIKQRHSSYHKDSSIEEEDTSISRQSEVLQGIGERAAQYL